ncbi:hypothetical protein [Streptomyces sp. NPDC058694]|uniref:hypothetical protein n=1 Tax=Streptomyces sp. NPDC058694 TaxID=3346603 RepID=UPI00364D61B8
MPTKARTSYAVALAAVGLLCLVPMALDAPQRPAAVAAAYDRLNDVQPHRGGAGLSVFPTATTYDCTAGFAVRSKSDPRTVGMVTAGHCFTRNRILGSGNDAGGAIDFGAVTVVKYQKNVPNGTHDMELITGVPSQTGPQTYAPTLWVDPRVPSAMRVVDTGAASLGDSLCYSGMVTRANCGFTVRTLTEGKSCSREPGHANDCTIGLAEATKPVSTGPRPGDSGSPVFKIENGNAVIVGMLVGGDPSSDGPPHRDAAVVFHTLQQIESPNGLNVSALTQSP